MATKNTLDNLLDAILEKVILEGIKTKLHGKPYRVEGYTNKRYPLYQDKAGYAMRLNEYKIFVIETSVNMDFLPDDNGKRMYMALKRKNTVVLEAHKIIWERKLLRDAFKEWEIQQNKAAEALIASLC